MTYPVTPPEPPPIVQTLSSEAINPASNGVTAPLSAIQSVNTNTNSLPTAPESFAAESSQLNAAMSAELLGPPVSVGYLVKRVEATNPSANSTEEGDAVAPLRSIQSLKVSDRSTSSTIAKLKKLTANPPNGSTVADAVAPSRSIQPLRVSNGTTSSTIAKLKKLTASDIEQTKPSPLAQPTSSSPQSSSVWKTLLQGISPRQSSATVVNPMVTGQASPQVQEGDRTNFTDDASESPLQPGELNFQAPAVEKPPTESIPTDEQTQPVVQPAPAPVPPQSPSISQPQSQPSGQSPPSSTPPVRERIIELNSDRQEYDEQRQVVTAEGNVLLRFDGGVLDADRLLVNLENLIAVGEGNVALTRGQQVLRGERFTYNFFQDSGDLQSGSGEIFIPTAGSDFSGTLPTDVTAGGVPPRPPSDRVTANQPLQQVTNTGGVQFSAGSGLPQQSGEVRRVRFQAERIDFYPEGWKANNVRFTNDPFSPPELEVRADTVTLTRETPYRDRIKTTRQRLVFDQGFSLPIPRDETVIDRRERDVSPAIATFGYDGEDRGGLFVERAFNPIETEGVRVSLTPQFFVQQALLENGGNIFDPSLYGLKGRLNANLGPQTSVTGSAVFESLDLGEIENDLRASLRLRQTIGTRLPHTLALEASYRDRLYNGSLGYQTVQNSLGGVLSSPVIPLGKTGVNLSYQVGAQRIKANTDRLDLLEPIRENNRISLNRLQGSAALSRGFLLWQGKPLPTTAAEGLRYTPAPVVPYVQAFVGVNGTSSSYSSGDNQTSVTGTIGIQGQFGHFSRPFLDYTAFNISYSQSIINGLSPFLFDRVPDTKILSAGLTQQIYGPFRIGFQTLLSLDTGQAFSTDYILEYSRRTYGITLRYNPELELGSLSLRISDFNWVGGSDPFSDSEVRPVVGGVRRENE